MSVLRLHRTDPMVRVGRVVAGAGLLIVAFMAFELALTGVLAEQTQRDLVKQFQAGVSTTQLGLPSALPAQGQPVALLKIPTLGVQKLVVEGSSPDDLKAGPGHVRVSPLPGEFGNAVIIGRRATYGAPFQALDRLRHGDTISVTTGQGTFTYRVKSVARTEETDATPLEGTLDSRLTLVTSDPAVLVSRRLVVVAMLQGSPVAVAKRVAPPATAGDLGLAADSVWLAPAAICLQLLIAAAVLAVRLGRRWPRSIQLMLAAPVIIALTALTFTTLDRVLPGSL